MALNAKHILFVNDYMISQNVTESYQKVYRCSDEAARKNGSRLMTNDDIRSEIERRQKKINEQIEEKTGLSVQWLVEEMIENHRLARRLGEIGNSSKALEMLGKHLGMFKEKVEITGSISIESMLDSV